MSSFSLGSISHATGSRLRDNPGALRPFRPKQVSSTETEKPMCLCLIPIPKFQECCSSYDVSGRWRCLNLDSFLETVSRCFQGQNEQAVERKRCPWRLPSSLFALRNASKRSLSTIRRKHSHGISVIDASCIYLILSAYLNHQSPLV